MRKSSGREWRPESIARLRALDQVALADANEVVVCSPALEASQGRFTPAPVPGPHGLTSGPLSPELKRFFKWISPSAAPSPLRKDDFQLRRFR